MNDMDSRERMSSSSVVVKADGVFGTKVDEELIIFHPESNAYYGAGPVGLKIWEALSEETSVTGIVDRIVEEFDVERSTCEQDVLSFLEDMRANGMIVVTSG